MSVNSIFINWDPYSILIHANIMQHLSTYYMSNYISCYIHSNIIKLSFACCSIATIWQPLKKTLTNQRHGRESPNYGKIK